MDVQVESRVFAASQAIGSMMVDLARGNWEGAEAMLEAGLQGYIEGVQQAITDDCGAEEGVRVFRSAMGQIAAQIGV
jgi:hypothetical protein